MERDTSPPWNDSVERDGSGGTYQYADTAELRNPGAAPNTKPRLKRPKPGTDAGVDGDDDADEEVSTYPSFGAYAGPQGRSGERARPAPPSTQTH